MKVTIVDYSSGNISSVINSFEEVAQNKATVEVTSDLNKIKSSDKIVLPGQGSFKSCVDALNKISGLNDTLNEFVIVNKKPLLGICVGLQMFADVGYEETETKGLGWISGKVSKIDNQNGKFKLPHIGWNQINILKDSKIFKQVENNSHMYFVHSYEFMPTDNNVISATTDYSTKVVCSVEKENIFGKIKNQEVTKMLDLNKHEILILWSLAVPIIFFGFYPEPLINTMEVSINNLIDMYNSNLSNNIVMSK